MYQDNETFPMLHLFCVKILYKIELVIYVMPWKKGLIQLNDLKTNNYYYNSLVTS